MALTRRTNGSSPTNIMQASWWNDYMDLLTGVMSDQPININNTVLANNFTADYSNTMGYWIQDSFGIAQRCMHVHTDGDLHLIPSPVNNKLRITKNSYAYDLAVFDASGANGATTLNGTLTLTGGTALLTCTTATVGTLNVTTLNASTFAPASVTCSGAVQGGSLVSNVLSDLVGNSHLSITTGAGAITRIQDPLKISLQVPGGSERLYVNSTNVTSNVILSAPVVHFATGGIAKEASGNAYASSGNSFNFAHTLGSSSVIVELIPTIGVFTWVSAVTTSTVTMSWAGGAPPYNVGWQAWLEG